MQGAKKEASEGVRKALRKKRARGCKALRKKRASWLWVALCRQVPLEHMRLEASGDLGEAIEPHNRRVHTDETLAKRAAEDEIND